MSIELPQFGDPKRVLFEYHPVGEGIVRTVGAVGQVIVRDAKHNLSLYEESRYDRSRNKMGERGFWDGFWEEAGSDYAALHLGVSIQSLENTMVDGGFSFTNHLKTFNEAVTGIWELKRRKVPEELFKPVSAGKWKEMATAVKEDPTFSIFFSSRKNLLPYHLRNFLRMSGAMPEIYKILPSYKEYAQGVLVGYEQTDEEIEEHRRTLADFDVLISKLSDPQIK